MAFERHQYTNGISPETAITIDSSDDDVDLTTLLRKHQTCYSAQERLCRVKREDNWGSIDIESYKHPEIYGHKRGKSRKRQYLANREHRTQRAYTAENPKVSALQVSKKVSFSSSKDGKGSRKESQDRTLNVCKAASQANILQTAAKKNNPQIAPQSTLFDDNQTQYLKADNREHISNIQKGNSLTTPNTSNKDEEIPVQAAYEPVINSNTKSALDATVRDEGYVEHGIDVQTQGRTSYAGENKKLTSLVHTDRVPESRALEEPQERTHIVSKVDSGVFTISEYKVHPDRNVNQFSGQELVPNSRQLDDLFWKPSTDSEEHEAALIQHFQRRQPPRETVIPKFKWEYAIKYVDGAELILDDEDKDKKAITVRGFANREEANKYLDSNTSSKGVGGLENIVSRTATLEGPERLLKVDLMLSDGQHHLMWVERGIVALKNLGSKKRNQEQWKANPRPKIPHYIVTCDLIKLGTSIVTRSDEHDDDNATSLSDQDNELGSYCVQSDLHIEKLHPETFTIRELANLYAGEVFLEKLQVDEREPSEVYWRECNVLPEHKKAEAEARKPDGLYQIEMEVYDMSSRFGWNKILVQVTEVDDVTGPVNF
ncbi:hypothetical protein F5Y12DRAFT_713588 [Xylaria sp. FL1777]|nr:hypothetical protein F5Y12DRAFT_713588 [Xylaria sp. FL1777]